MVSVPAIVPSALGADSTVKPVSLVLPVPDEEAVPPLDESVLPVLSVLGSELDEGSEDEDGDGVEVVGVDVPDDVVGVGVGVGVGLEVGFAVGVGAGAGGGGGGATGAALVLHANDFSVAVVVLRT